jgi:hypothetical protein
VKWSSPGGLVRSDRTNDVEDDVKTKKRPAKKKRRKAKTLKDLVRFFHEEGWEVSIVAKPLQLVARPKPKKRRNTIHG